jgi:hypothetical protein
VGNTVEQLRPAGQGGAPASAPHRAACVAAALRTRLVRTLITDERTARALAGLRETAAVGRDAGLARGAVHRPRCVASASPAR